MTDDSSRERSRQTWLALYVIHMARLQLAHHPSSLSPLPFRRTQDLIAEDPSGDIDGILIIDGRTPAPSSSRLERFVDSLLLNAMYSTPIILYGREFSFPFESFSLRRPTTEWKAKMLPLSASNKTYSFSRQRQEDANTPMLENLKYILKEKFKLLAEGPSIL